MDGLTAWKYMKYIKRKEHLDKLLTQVSREGVKGPGFVLIKFFEKLTCFCQFSDGRRSFVVSVRGS